MDLSSASPLASYALAKVESFLEGLAEVQSISPAQLIGEVGALLTNGTGTRAKVETSHSRAGQAEDEAKEGIKPASLAKRAYRARARQANQTVHGTAIKPGTFWSRLSPAERSAEMKRRQLVALRRRRRSNVAKFPLGGVA